mgnify:CR=1 FL=1
MDNIKKQFQQNKKDYVGDTYSYSNNILAPSSIGMSDKGNLEVLANDIAGLMSYTQLMVEGGGYASKSGKPMGNSYFLKTLGKCIPTNIKGVATKPNEKVQRYIYINNIPQGDIKGLEGDFSNFRGLIPGILNNITAMDPTEILGGLMEGLDPSCAKIKMNVVDINNNSRKESKHVALSDIKNLSPCLFGGKGAKNPITGKVCGKSGFTNMTNTKTIKNKKPKANKLANIYNLTVSVFFIYLLYKIFKKN